MNKQSKKGRREETVNLQTVIVGEGRGKFSHKIRNLKISDLPHKITTDGCIFALFMLS